MSTTRRRNTRALKQKTIKGSVIDREVLPQSRLNTHVTLLGHLVRVHDLGCRVAWSALVEVANVRVTWVDHGAHAKIGDLGDNAMGPGRLHLERRIS